MTVSTTRQTAGACDEATRQWRERGARLDANIQWNMWVVMTVVAIALTISAIWVLTLN
jgi:cytoskeletal protein RodZ